MSENEIREEVNKEFAYLSDPERDAIIRSRLLIQQNQGKLSELIKVDLGPYASRIMKFTMYREEEYMDNPLKFIHINNDETNRRKNYPLSLKDKRANRSRTVAVLSLSPTAVKKLVAAFLAGEELYLDMTVGVQTVSLSDNYNKATGRDLSVKKMKKVALKVESVKIDDNFINVRLETHESVNLSIRLNKKTGFSTVFGRLA